MSRLTLVLLGTAAVCAAAAIALSRPVSPLPPPDRPELEDAALADTIPEIRVLLDGKSRAAVSVRIEGPYQVTAIDSWHVLAQGNELPESRVAAEEGGLKIGKRVFASRELRLQPIEDATLWVGSRRYRGGLELRVRTDGSLSAVNRLPLEDYLASVLSGEMPPDFPAAAREAQMIAARTYALFQLKTAGRRRAFDVYASTRSQNYGGLQYTTADGRQWAVETPATRRLAKRTAGVVLLYQGRLFCAHYGAVCGGRTACGWEVFQQAAPPLVGVACEHCRDAPNYRWERTLELADVQPRLANYLMPEGRKLGALQAIDIRGGEKGSVPTAVLRGTEGERELAASLLRQRILGTELPSAFLASVEVTDDSLVVRGRGWGHGVGLCQHGARQLAESGLSCEEILAYYYPGTQLGRVK